jgi:transaldolase
MNKNPLLVLESFGQSIWLDYLQRNGLENGDFKQWIDRDGASGLTSNPSIFEKAIAESHDYDNAIRALVLDGKSVEEIYQTLTIEGTQEAQRVLEGLRQVGIDLDALTQQLEDEGVMKFDKAFDQSLATLSEKRAAMQKTQVGR